MQSLAKTLTGKSVRHESESWYQEIDTIITPQGDEEGLLHEICHFIVASDAERRQPNLALDEEELDLSYPTLKSELPDWTPGNTLRREYQACYLEKQVYALKGLQIPSYSPCNSMDPDPNPGETISWCDERVRSFSAEKGLPDGELIRSMAETIGTIGRTP